MSYYETVLIYKPADSEIPLGYFDRLFKQYNFMSYGILAYNDGGLEWRNNESDFFDKEDFFADFNELKDKQIAISFSEEIQFTQKELSDANPYFVSSKLGYCISADDILINNDNQKYNSEKLNFRESLKIISDFWYVDKFEDALSSIEKSLYSCSIIFIDDKGEYSIFNEGIGTWKNKVWYSDFDYNYDSVAFNDTKKEFSFDQEYDDYLDVNTPQEVCESCRAFDLDVTYNTLVSNWLCKECEEQLCSDLSDT